MKLFAALLLAVSLCGMAQTKNEDAISPEFRAAAVDGLSCLDALEDTVTQGASAYAAQKTKCEESLSKAHLLASTKADSKLYGAMALLRMKIHTCRVSWTLNNFEEARKCLADARASRADAEAKVKGKPQPDKTAAAPPAQ